MNLKLQAEVERLNPLVEAAKAAVKKAESQLKIKKNVIT